MIKIEDYAFPEGLHLLIRWQAGDGDAKQEMTDIFDAAIAGESAIEYSFVALTRMAVKTGLRVHGIFIARVGGI